MKHDFCVSHNYTQRDLLLLPSLLPTTILFLLFFLGRDYASRDQIYHLTLRNTTVRTETPL